MEDFKTFLAAAHRAGACKVMIELLMNHTSDPWHAWFQHARRAPKGSPERDYYVWNDSDQIYSGDAADHRLTDTEKSNWTCRTH